MIIEIFNSHFEQHKHEIKNGFPKFKSNVSRQNGQTRVFNRGTLHLTGASRGTLEKLRGKNSTSTYARFGAGYFLPHHNGLNV